MNVMQTKILKIMIKVSVLTFMGTIKMKIKGIAISYSSYNKREKNKKEQEI